VGGANRNEKKKDKHEEFEAVADSWTLKADG
jgi:hypothetical protein